MSLKDYGLDGECLRKAIHIDAEQEYMLGDDQAYFCYPIRFPTVEFELRIISPCWRMAVTPKGGTTCTSV